MLLKSKPTGKRSPRQIERDLARYREDLSKAEADNDAAAKAKVLNNLGTIQIDKKNYPKALLYLEQAMDLLESNAPQDRVSVYGNAASAARGAEEWDKALRYGLMAESLAIYLDVKEDLEVLRLGIALVRKHVSVEFFAEQLTAAQQWLPEYLRPFARVELHLSPLAQEKSPVTPGRNGPCPCGSGRKYKHCCG